MKCSFCQELMFTKENLPVQVLKCGHVFHLDCVADAVKHKTSFCPLCKVRFGMRHTGPLHLHADDLADTCADMSNPLIGNTQNETDDVSEQNDPLENIGMNVHNDVPELDVGQNVELDQQNSGGVHVQVEPNRNDNVPRFAIVANPTIEQQVAGGINPTAPKQINIRRNTHTSIDNESRSNHITNPTIGNNLTASNRINVRRHTVGFDPNATVVYTVRRSANLFGNANAQNIGSGQNMTRKGSIVDATKENNANDAENSSDKIGSKSVVKNKENVASNGQNSVGLEFGVESTQNSNDTLNNSGPPSVDVVDASIEPEVASVDGLTTPNSTRRTGFHYDRNVRIARPEPKIANVSKRNTEMPTRRKSHSSSRSIGNATQVETRVRPKRTPVPMKRYNVGVVVCCVCNKSFRDDIAVQHYGGPVVCSFKCFRADN